MPSRRDMLKGLLSGAAAAAAAGTGIAKALPEEKAEEPLLSEDEKLLQAMTDALNRSSDLIVRQIKVIEILEELLDDAEDELEEVAKEPTAPWNNKLYGQDWVLDKKYQISSPTPLKAVYDDATTGNFPFVQPVVAGGTASGSLTVTTDRITVANNNLDGTAFHFQGMQHLMQ